MQFYMADSLATSSFQIYYKETVKEENFHGDEELRETGGETSTSDINENDSCTITEKLCQLLHFIKTTIMPLKKTECGHLASMIHFVILLSSLLVSSCTSNVVECPKVQYIRLTARAVVKCTELVDFPFIYWYNNIDKDASALIQKVNGEVAGIGYTTGEFNIDNEGSLVINDVKIHDERTFRVKALDSTLSASIYDITLIVYVEPGEPLPVIPECSEQSTCIHKVDSHRVISCIHGESRPAMEVSWFLRDGREDRLLNATINQMVSEDAVTITTSATLAVDEIPVDANVALVLVCKTIQPIPNANGSERVILLDFSVDVPFTDEEYLAPVYAFEREEDFKIKCLSGIDTTSNVVLWMFKSLNSENFEYILHSAFGEMAFTTEDNDGFNLTDSGALVIKKVDLQHEGYYACVSSLENTMESSVQNLEVIVLPKPPRIVVQGCEPFQPCHLSAREAETITCTVDGVRPQVDLSIETYSTNVAVTKSAVSSHIEDGLFYTTVEGHVNVSKVTCEENHVTVICQARGTAAYGFMSDVFVTIPVDGKDCIESMTATFVQEGEGCRNHLQVWTFVITVLFLLVHSACTLFLSRKIQVLKKFQHKMESQPLQSGTINGNPPPYVTTAMSTSEEETSGASQKESHI